MKETVELENNSRVRLKEWEAETAREKITGRLKIKVPRKQNIRKLTWYGILSESGREQQQGLQITITK